jgi:hypothetical protein
VEVLAVGGGDVHGVVGEEFEVPAGFVDEPVVVAAEEHEVVAVGGAAVFPGDDVVGVAPLRWAVAAGEPAVAVA